MDSSYSDVKPPVVRRMLKHFDLASDAESDNRTRGLAALKFRHGGKEQWDEAFLAVYEEDNRPHDSYNQIPQFVHQVTNDMRMNMAQIRFIPNNDDDKEIAEIYEDLVRNIQTDSEAEVAYDTAADSQVTIGWGYWRYITEYENEKSFDQIIKTKWIPNPFTIYDDPYAVEPDRSDRKKLLQVCDINVKDFNYEYDRKYDSDDLQSIGDSSPRWATDNTVRIGEYWEVSDTRKTLYRKKATATAEAGEPVEKLPKGAKQEEYETREISTPKVMWYKCTGLEVLEEREWPGIYIPYVSVVGEQLNVDGQWKLSGLVESMIAPQKQYNYWVNAATEAVASMPLTPYVAAVGQIDGPLAEIWDKANIRRYPYLPYNPTALNGQPLPPPQRQSTSADIAPMISLVQQAQNNFYAVTGIYPASLGKQGNEQSGKAIIARQKEGDVSTFHFSDNMSRSQRFGGRILEDLIKKIYDGSRTIKGTKEDRSTRTIKVNQRFTDQNGEQKEYDLTSGYYDVVVTTGPSFTTKRQESQEFYLSLAQSDPNIMAVAGDIIIGSSDMAGADKIAERLKKANPLAMQDDEKKGEIPPEVQMAIQQLSQKNEQLQQVAQQQAQELQSKQGEYAAKEKDAQSKIQIEEMKLQGEREKMDFEREKMGFELKSQLLQTGDDMKLNRDALLAQLAELDQTEQQQQEAEMQFQMQQQMMAEQEAQEAAVKQAKEQQDAMRSDMLLQSLGSIQQNLQMLTSSILAPKEVVRDPVTGLVQGVVTKGTIQ